MSELKTKVQRTQKWTDLMKNIRDIMKTEKWKKYDKKGFRGNNRHKHMLYVYTEEII